jgi:hypothetical protein
MVTCILSRGIFLVRWKGNINYLLLSEILFINMQVAKKFTRILEIMSKKGIGIIPKFLDMLKTKNCSLLTIVKMLLTNLQMGRQKRKQGRFGIWHNLAFIATRMSHARV